MGKRKEKRKKRNKTRNPQTTTNKLIKSVYLYQLLIQLTPQLCALTASSLHRLGLVAGVTLLRDRAFFNQPESSTAYWFGRKALPISSEKFLQT